MALIKIKFGKGDLAIVKSKKFVGLKRSQDPAFIGNYAVTSEIKETRHGNLAGFQVVKVRKKKGELLNEKLDFMRGMDEVETGTHVYHIPGSDKPLVPTGTIYVTFDEKLSAAEQEKIVTDLKLNVKERRTDNRLVVNTTSESSNPITCATKLQEHTAVKWAEPDMDTELDFYAFANPSARLMGHMWHLRNTGGIPDNSSVRMRAGADAKVVEAWRLLDGFGNPNIVVAVIDNGFDTTHPDLNQKIVRPWDLWDRAAKLRLYDPNFPTLNPHGTPCASVAIAPQNGGMCGAAPSARFMPLNGTSFSIESTEEMFDYCVRNGAHVISCSWGSIEPHHALGTDKFNAISRAARDGRGGLGCVICFAAGNEGQDVVNVYGQHPDVICVGASTSDDTYADYSNRGRELTVVAPSNGDWPILAARAFWDEGIDGEVGASKFYYGDGVDRGSRYQHFGGTSSATPLVAGICALILSANPRLTAREVKQILCQTADKIGSPSEYSNGHSRKFGYGRVNAANAVREALRRAGRPATTPTAPTAPTQPTRPTTPTTPTTPTQPSTPSVPAGSSPTSAGLYRFANNARLVSKGFSVQAGSFSQWANVKSIAPGLETKFKTPVLVHIAGSGSATVYRILVGQFATLSDANKMLAILKNNGVNGFAKDLSTLG